MRRLVLSCLLLAGFMLIPLRAEARQRFTGICITGNETINANRRVHNASCTVRVFDTGTVNLSTIFSDNAGTALANPFTAGTDGFYFFYADDGKYDVQMSAGTPAISSAKTIGDVRLADGGFTTILAVAFSATPTFDASVADTFTMTLTGNVTSSTITNPVAGKVIRFILTQDATGGWTFAFPADTVRRLTLVDTDVSAITVVSFIYTGANWEEISTGSGSIGPSRIGGTAHVCPTAPCFTDIETAYDTLSVGGEVHVHAATYTISDTIDMDVANTTLSFEGGVTISYTGSTGCAIEVSKSFIEIRNAPDITLTSSDAGANGICINGGTNLVIEAGITKSTNSTAVAIAQLTVAAAPTGAVRTGCPSACVSTITTTAAHGLVVNDYVYVESVTDISFNGIFKIVSVPTTTTFTFNDTFIESDTTSGSGTVDMGQWGIVLAHGLLSKFYMKGCRELDVCTFSGVGGGGNFFEIFTQNGGGVDINTVLKFGGGSGTADFRVLVSGGGSGASEINNGVFIGGTSNRNSGSIYFEDGAIVGNVLTYADAASNNHVTVRTGAAAALVVCSSTGDDNTWWDTAKGGPGSCDSDISFGNVGVNSRVTLKATEVFDGGALVTAPDVHFADIDLLKVGGSIDKQFTLVDRTTSGGIHSKTIAANSLGKTAGIKLYAVGSITGVNDAKTLSVEWDGTTVVTCSLGAADVGEWVMEAVVMNRDATGAQRVYGTITFTASAGTSKTCVETGINLGKDTTTSLVIRTATTIANSSDHVISNVFTLEVF